MSDPPPRLPPPQTAASISTATEAATSSLVREYRKGNWTLQETVTLITAKRLDEQRRSRPSTSSSSPPLSKPAGELRWKWVENYCWEHGCYRSQNQCNDKWDNLLRDYKKVCNYQSQSDGSDSFLSYWSMDRGQRKLHNLPTNVSAEVFTALNDVVQAKYGSPPLLLPLPSPPLPHEPPEEQQQPEVSAADPATAPPAVAGEEATPATVSGRSDSSDTKSSDQSQSREPKSKKVRKIGSSIRRNAAALARTIRSCEERNDQRHREIIELEQRRLRIQETRDEVNRRGIADVVAAVANLSGAIQSLIASRYNNHT